MEGLEVSRTTFYDYLNRDLIPNTQLKKPRGKRVIRNDALELIQQYGLHNWRRALEMQIEAPGRDESQATSDNGQ